MNAVKKFAEAVNKVNDTMIYVVAVGIFLTGVVVVYSIFMRFLFSKPPIWSFDLTSLLSASTAILAGGWCLKIGGHVRVDIFWEKLSVKNRTLLDMFTSIFMFSVAVVLVWKGGAQVLRYFDMGSVASSGLNIHLWLKWLIMPIGGILILLQGIVNFIDDLCVFTTGKKLLAEEV